MTLISYSGRAVALAGREQFTLAPHISQRPDGDPVTRFVCFLALYARDVALGVLPGEPGRSLPECAERYARECLLPEHDFRARAHRSNRELAQHFGVPLEQIPARRAELAAGLPAPARVGRRPRCQSSGPCADEPHGVGPRCRSRATTVRRLR